MDAQIERRFRPLPEGRLAGLIAGFAAKKAGKYLAKKVGQKYGAQAVDLVGKTNVGAGLVNTLDEAGVLKQLGVRPVGSWKSQLIKKLDEPLFEIDGQPSSLTVGHLAGANLGVMLQPEWDPRKDDDEPFPGTLLRYGERTKMPGFDEVFESRAFGDLADRDLILNLFHRRDRPVARTRGGGLVIEEADDEIRLLIDLPPTRDGEDARELIGRGIIRGLSVEFRSQDEIWEGKLRRIKQAELLGAGLVDSPQYSGSRISQRALERATGREYADERDVTIWL